METASERDLFGAANDESPAAPRLPLAARMRPTEVTQVRGQSNVLLPGSPLRRLIEGRTGPTGPLSASLWGPPGTGKTTLAHLVAKAAGRSFIELSAVSAGVKDVRAVLDQATTERSMYGRQCVLFLDEIHRFSKAQQDALLPGVENRLIVLIAATTENPSFSVIAPLLSRSMLVRLESLADDDVRALLAEALSAPRGLAGKFRLDDAAADHIVAISGGDARRALTTLEAAAGVAEDAVGMERGHGPDIVVGEQADEMATATTTATTGTTEGTTTGSEEGKNAITLRDAEQALDQAAVRYDRTGDQHYDVASAFIKSMRGSDVDAALHYLARQLEAGEDPRFIARRIVISASEDVGMADPTALQTAVAAMHAVAHIGMPEARIVLAQAVVHNALAPKSNASYTGINEAVADIRAGRGGAVPASLRGSAYTGAATLGHGAGYRYTHDENLGVGQQQFLPDDLTESNYYRPTTRGFEERLAPRWQWLRTVIRGLPAATTEADEPRLPEDNAGQR
ncbi:MAG: replication-associated recombination protein A [Ornithinimicrobium sp.]